VLLTASCATLAAQAPAPPAPVAAAPAQAAATAHFAYDVVSVKPYKADALNGMTMWWRSTKDGFSASGVTLDELMINAYGLLTTDQIEGLPDWGGSAQFSIDAKMDEDAATAFQKLPRMERAAAQRQMIQAMLADRFHLTAHHEMKDRPVYDLVIAKGGLKMKESPADAPGGYSTGNGKLTGKGIGIDTLTFSLSNEVERLVVDKTGLTGKYDIVLQWTSDDQQGSADAGPSIFTALEEQIGLKLVAAKGPVDTIVIEHIERPSGN
jgi:uncharacterized protein (TIGR03435 family)